jgi:ELWxxDGT repeat protein
MFHTAASRLCAATVPTRVRRRLLLLMAALAAAPAFAAGPPAPYLVRDINPTEAVWSPECNFTCFPSPVYRGSLPTDLTPLGNRVFFMAFEGAHGLEPWVSDGTEAGTFLLADLWPFYYDSTPHFIGKLGGRVLFWADEIGGGYYRTLFATDGTPAGTTELSLPCSPECGDQTLVTAELEGQLFLAAYSRRQNHSFLYRTDGTPAGGHLAADLCPGGISCSRNVREMVVWKGQLYYLTNYADEPGRLYRLSSAEASPVEVLAACEAKSHLTPLGDRLLFAGTCPGGPPGRSLYALDGPEATPRLVQDFNSGSDPDSVATWGGDRAAVVVGHKLWITDGAAGGTVPVAGMLHVTWVVPFRDLLLVSGTGESQVGLFALDRAGHLTLLRAGPIETPAQPGGDFAFFTSRESTTGSEPWFTDGTPAGTGLLADLRPGPESSSPGFVRGGDLEGYVLAGEHVFFPADDGQHDSELWAVKIGSAPRIVTPPASQQIQPGAAVSFTVAAEGSAPLSYQWLRNGAPIAGATGATYTLAAVTQADHGAQLAVTVSNAFGSVTSAPATLTVVVAHGLLGTYFGDPTLGAARLQRIDPQVDFNWGTGSPAANLPADNFSVRWTGEVEAPATATYTFHVRSDDGVRLWIDDRLVIDDWGPHPARNAHGTIALAGGHRYRLRLEYRALAGNALVRLLWSRPGMPRQVVPSVRLFPGS